MYNERILPRVCPCRSANNSTKASNWAILVARHPREKFAKSSHGAIRNLKSNFLGGVAARIYESAYYGRVTLGTSTPLASGNASVMKRGGQEAIVVNSRLPTYSEREKEVWSFFCSCRPLLLLLLLVIPLRAINSDAIESFVDFSLIYQAACVS